MTVSIHDLRTHLDREYPFSVHHQVNALSAVIEERDRQDVKWGEAAGRALPLTVWQVVLAEEFGEVCHEILEHDAAKLRTEAIHLAAVALALVEVIDAQIVGGAMLPWGFRDDPSELRKGWMPPAMLKVERNGD